MLSWSERTVARRPVPSSTTSWAAARNAIMCSRPAWPLRIITRRTPLRTKSARTSRTKPFSASTDTLTVPGYGRVVVQTPYGMAGATNAFVRRATSSTTWSGWMTSAPRGRCRPCSSSAPTGMMTTGSFFAIAANSSEVISSRRTRRNPGERGDRGGRRARRVAPNLPAGRRRRGHRRGHRIGLSARPREPDRGGTRAPCLRPAVASRPGAPGARLSRGWLRHRLLQRLGGRPRRKLARAAMGRRCRPRAAPSPEDARRPSVRGRGRVRDAGVGRSSVRAINRGRARDAGLARHGRRVARRRSPTRAEAEPRIVSSAAPRGSNRLEIAEEEVAVLLVFDCRADFPREGQVRSEVSLPPRDRVGAGEGLVGEGEREILDPGLLARREGSDRMVCRRLGPTEDRIDVGDLPVADRSIHRRSDLAPVKAGRMRGVDHALVFGGRARLLEEPPDLFEQTYGHLAMPLALCRRWVACHGALLRRLPSTRTRRRGDRPLRKLRRRGPAR